MHDAVKLDPEWVERPFPHPAAMAHLAHRQLVGGDRHLLIGARGTVIGAERPIDQEYVEAEKAENRPGADRDEEYAANEADAADKQHEDQEAGRPERTMRGQDGRENFGIG